MSGTTSPEVTKGQPGTTIPFDKAQNFLTQETLPFWSTQGAYSNGSFVECLDLTGKPADPGFTRVRVQARQIYVFSHAMLNGVYPQPDLCARATDFFIRSAWLGPERGWAKLINKNGGLIDATSDLYDISFALFALGWRYRVSRDPRCLKIAHETLDFLDAHMRHPLGGFKNDAVSSQPRQQNPHMHLIEAMNVWIEASRDTRFLELADEIVTLFVNHFHDKSSGALGEYFKEDWTPADGPAGDIVEPGHQFEWAWILGHYGRLSGCPQLDVMSRIMTFGFSHGYDAATGLTIDQLGRDGRPLAMSRRLWPQTEALKACLASAEFLGVTESEKITKIVDALFEHFLRPGPIPGSWIDHYHADWSPIADKVPTTSLYHLTLAFFELIRLRAFLEGGMTDKH
jgi:mannose/cellobiose epimerase-like protein (N-acyl-D-glucosamine 2-epimerase family)